MEPATAEKLEPRPMTMDEIQQSIFDILTSFEPTAEGLEGEEKEEFTAFVTAQLESLAQKESEKADAFAYAIRHAEMEAEFFKREAERFAQRRQTVENRIRAMKDRITYILLEYSLKEIAGKRYKLALRKSQRVITTWEDPTKYPDEYIRVIPEKKEIDKNALKDALKIGKEIEGASLQDNWTTQIR
jgi:hypothetical protein